MTGQGNKVNPILLDLPMPITTDRLILRPAQAGDGAEVNAAILESWDEFHKWLPFAKVKPTLEESEENIRRSHAKWILREDLRLMIFDRASGQLVGNSGLHRFNWSIPSFEIGYWARKSCGGKGFITESTNALTRYAFQQLKAKRVELRFDPKNNRSIAIAKRLGFEHEGCLRNALTTPDGNDVRDSLVYSRVTAEGLPTLNISW